MNRKTTVWLRSSVTEALRRAETERAVDEALVEARLTYKDASAATKRRWNKVAEMVKSRLRVEALASSTRLVGLDGKPL